MFEVLARIQTWDLPLRVAIADTLQEANEKARKFKASHPDAKVWVEKVNQ